MGPFRIKVHYFQKNPGPSIGPGPSIWTWSCTRSWRWSEKDLVQDQEHQDKEIMVEVLFLTVVLVAVEKVEVVDRLIIVQQVQEV